MTTNRKELHATNIAACNHGTPTMLTITHDQFVVAINNVYYAVLGDPTKGLNAIDLRTLVMHILNTYA
jgi:hypothetical protein